MRAGSPAGSPSDAPERPTGAWRRRDADTVEIKRMYVTSAARRRGLARQILAELERTAGAEEFQAHGVLTGLAGKDGAPAPPPDAPPAGPGTEGSTR